MMEHLEHLTNPLLNLQRLEFWELRGKNYSDFGIRTWSNALFLKAYFEAKLLDCKSLKLLLPAVSQSGGINHTRNN